MGINLMALANLAASQNPQIQQIMQQVQGMAKAGNSPEMIMGALEQQFPALKENNMWGGIRGKSGAEIEQYANNLAGTLGIFNK